ncbi:nuclease-related domain-containing protein [Streptomyces sp. 8ZJF_21]|uniref:nuclease-related domain-containing protein n=1 Tax=Streptomyces sp. 8ZJF_21 TaxID=2903141 RepID=UPI0027E3FAD7|nr:nuclease-related domain-containing protein [Streptomyces sp. 8ZJF_21]
MGEGTVEELRVQPWRRYGHERLYVNRSTDGKAVAWYDCKTGFISVLDEEYRDHALTVLAPYLTGKAASHQPSVAPTIENSPPGSLTPKDSDDVSLNRPGDALRRHIETIEPNRLLRMLARWWNVSEAHSWIVGLRGERITGARLNRLSNRGWHILHSIELPSGADIDHIAIGPPGVFTINTKHHRGKSIWLGDHAITVNRSSTRYLQISQSEASVAAKRLSATCGWPVEVRPVLAVVGAAKITAKSAVPPVLVINGTEADRRLSGLTPKLSPTQVAEIFSAARQRQTWQD